MFIIACLNDSVLLAIMCQRAINSLTTQGGVIVHLRYVVPVFLQ